MCYEPDDSVVFVNGEAINGYSSYSRLHKPAPRRCSFFLDTESDSFKEVLDEIINLKDGEIIPVSLSGVEYKVVDYDVLSGEFLIEEILK